jgi:hypothetical protein
MIKKSANLFTIVVFLMLAGGLLAQDKTSPEAYSGVAIGTGGSGGGKTLQFDFRVTQYTTDEELQDFAQLLKDKGPDALRAALEKEDKGRINAVGSTGNQIAVARKRQQGADTIITIVTPPVQCLLWSSIATDEAPTTPSVIFR